MPAPRSFSQNAWANLIRSQQLAQAEAPRYAPSGRALTWTPTIEAFALTPPTLGSGGLLIQEGLYVVENNLFIGWFHIQFGSGMTTGNDTRWQFVMPSILTTPAAAVECIGGYHLEQSATGNILDGSIGFSNNGRIELRYPATWPAGLGTFVGFNTPWTWAAVDDISGFLVARLADGYNN